MPRKSRPQVIVLDGDLEERLQTVIVEHDLPERVHDVFRAALLGMGISETVARLGLARNTVKRYRSLVCKKLKVSRIAELLPRVLLGVRSG
jgi:DNA-binding NarL/FixJ family response regulator